MLHVFAWFALIAGVTALCSLFWVRSRFKKEYSWAQERGVIIESEVKWGWDTYRTQVRYEYTFKSRTFVGTTIRSGEITYNWPGSAKDLNARYPKDSRVTVYVNPHNPWDSVLEPGGDRAFTPFMLVVSIFMILVASLMLFN